MATYAYNKIEIDGNYNIVLQNTDGSTQSILFDTFFQQFTKEKDERIKALEETLKDKQKIEELSDFKINILKSELQGLQEDKKFLEERIQLLLKDFSDRDILETSTLYQESFNLFINGQLEEAIDSLDEEKLLEQESKLQTQREKQAETRLLKAELLSLKFEYKEAAINIEKMVECLSTWKTRFEAGNFYGLLHDYEKAKKHYDQALLLELDNTQRASVLSNIASVYTQMRLYNDAERSYNEAIRIRRILAKDNPETLFAVASLLSALGVLKKITHDYNDAITIFNKSLKMLEEIDSNGKMNGLPILFDYMHLVAQNLTALADAYTNIGNTADAEKKYKNALSIFDALFFIKPKAYNFIAHGKAICLANLGFFYQNMDRSEEAESVFNEALSIYEEITANNPQIYDSDFALLLRNMGLMYGQRGVEKGGKALLYEMKKDFNKALGFLDKSLSMRRVLMESNPQTHLVALAEILSNFGPIYKRINRVPEAEAIYKEVMDIYRKLFINEPEIYRINLTHSALSLGMLYYTSLRDKNKSLIFLKEVVHNSHILLNNYPDVNNHLNIDARNYISTSLETVKQWGVNPHEFFNDAIKNAE